MVCGCSSSCFQTVRSPFDRSTASCVKLRSILKPKLDTLESRLDQVRGASEAEMAGAGQAARSGFIPRERSDLHDRKVKPNQLLVVESGLALPFQARWPWQTVNLSSRRSLTAPFQTMFSISMWSRETSRISALVEMASWRTLVLNSTNFSRIHTNSTNLGYQEAMLP